MNLSRSSLAAALLFVSAMQCAPLATAQQSLAGHNGSVDSDSSHARTSDLSKAGPVVIEDGGTGPFKAVAMEEAGLPGMTIYRPASLEQFGGALQLPVLLWGNGACANTTQEHKNFLSELASHGYLILAIGRLDQIQDRDERSRTPTSSAELLFALEWLSAQVKTPGTAYSGKVDLSKVAAMGMSCGGLQAIEIAGDPRICTTVVCNSGVLPSPSPMKGMPGVTKEALKQYHGPVLYLMGGPSDIAYKNAMDDFSRIESVPVAMVNRDVGHGGTYSRPHGGEFAMVALAWLDWQLKGSQEAAKQFLGTDSDLKRDPKWTLQVKNFRTP
jgi:hypothetical protein